MDGLGGELLNFLATKNLKEARHKLYDLLGADFNELNIYYLTPLSNLKRIIKDDGIKCRALMPGDATDLSGLSVQKRRDKPLELAQRVTDANINKINKGIHECINFFWNPLNHTSYAFQRNALLLSVDDDYTIDFVCILELQLNAFFECNKVFWSASKQNLASDDFCSFLKREYTEFDWATIFSIDDDSNTNPARSAEFVAFYSNPPLTISDLIPAQFIKRILVSTQYEPLLVEMLPSVQGRIHSINNPKIFYPKSMLLHAEKELVKTAYYLQKSRLSVEMLSELVNTFSTFKEQLGCNVTDKYFISKNIAYSFHGIGHITRVMFWVHVLCFLSNIDRQTEEVALYAAFIHDFCRKDHRMEEEEHGFAAAHMYKDFLRQKKIPHRLLYSCLNAVTYHCKDDSECPDNDRDLLWKLLKDADSLDRGRFGHPRQGRNGIKRESRGCDIEYLRCDIFQDSPHLARELAWLAYRVAFITQYTKWSENTFRDLKNEIRIGLKAILRNDILDKNCRQIANKMFRYLSVA